MVLGIITPGIFLASWYSWTLMTRQKMFFFHAFAKSREWLWLNGLFSPLKHNQWNKAKFGMTTKWGFQEARTRKDLKITLLVVRRSGGFNAKFMRFPTPFVFLPPWCERSLGFVTWGSSRRSLWSVPFQVCRPMSSFVSNKFKSNGYWERIINFAFVNSTFFNFSNWVPFDGENLKEKQAEKDLNSLKILVVGLKRWKEKDRGQCSKPDTLLTKPQKMVKFHTIPDFHLSFFTSRPLSLFSKREYETKQMGHVLHQRIL